MNPLQSASAPAPHQPGNDTRNQMSALMGVAMGLAPHLYDDRVDTAFDDAARKAALTTFQGACMRMDVIMKENARWGQKEEAPPPSTQYPVHIEKTGDGWLCWFGADRESCVEGWGPTPAEALKAFDLAFYHES